MSVHEKLKIQTYLSILIAVAAFMHIFIGVYFWWLDLMPIVILSVIDVLVYAVAFLICRAGKTRVASFIFVIKVMMYSVIATYLFGITINAHWFALVAALPAVLYLDFTKIQKYTILVLVPIIVNVQLVFPLMFPTPFDMADNAFLGFFFANVIMSCFAMIIAVHVLITRKIDSMQSKEIEDYKHMSNVDPLTELSNRRYAELYFEKLKEDDQEPFLFCLIDIDNFKHVNDTHGHEIGDKVLLTVSDILQKSTRQTDLVCRWGGEEFLIGLSKCDVKCGENILNKIRKAVEESVVHTELGDIKITITGGASYLEDGEIKVALENCDKNLYEGKRNGKNVIVI
ncbi:MAG: GGDEF domain-containing protein [Defluviitaleaceae bacterium]|nr:GGDEF domain-containing protein [Defluviitaleaceae bacterium]